MAWSRPVGWALDHLVYRTSVTGKANVPTGGPVIFAGNHISFLDGPVMFGASPRPMHILVKQEMFKGFLGRVLTASGQLPVDRQGDRAALQRSRTSSPPAVALESSLKEPGGAVKPPISTAG
jgi:1-acyl-sn-glycerol-3-phosphate acyltransferase